MFTVLWKSGGFPVARTGRKSDQFQLRLPNGLRDRIKAYAEPHGRSMNAEIVRVLEREYPAHSTLEERVDELLSLVGFLNETPTAGAFDNLSEEIIHLIRRMASGKIKGIEGSIQDELASMVDSWEEIRSEPTPYDPEYDE